MSTVKKHEDGAEGKLHGAPSPRAVRRLAPGEGLPREGKEGGIAARLRRVRWRRPRTFDEGRGGGGIWKVADMSLLNYGLLSSGSSVGRVRRRVYCSETNNLLDIGSCRS